MWSDFRPSAGFLRHGTCQDDSGRPYARYGWLASNSKARRKLVGWEPDGIWNVVGRVPNAAHDASIDGNTQWACSKARILRRPM